MAEGQGSGESSPDILRGSRLLEGLSEADRNILRPLLSRVVLRQGEALFQPGEEVTSVHFPCGGTTIALVVLLPPAEMAQAGVIGCEGAVGAVVSRGRKPAFVRAVAQIPGEACRIEIDALEEAQSRSPTLADAIARYSDCLLAYLLQAVACNRLHTLEQRMASLLLWVQDRQERGDLPLTQEDLGAMLGVGRTYVTKTAAAFQAQGLIGYRRGHIRVLDRPALSARCCPCPSLVRDHFERVLPGVHPLPAA